MLQFFQGQEKDWAALEARARGRCLRYRAQQMPPETTPPQAAIGFEILPDTGEALLLVDRGLTYHGEVEDLFHWFCNGEKRFASFANLREWVQGPLARAFDSAPVAASAEARTSSDGQTLECVEEEGSQATEDAGGAGSECVEDQPSDAVVVNTRSAEESGPEG